MALVIPKDVGGTVDIQGLPSQAVAPIETRSAALVIPSDVGGTFEPQQPQVQAAPETGFADIFTGSERIAATPELGTLPEFGTTAEGDALIAAFKGGDIGAATKISAGLLSTANPKAQMDIIQSAIPEAVFETTPDGSTIIEVPTADGGTRRSVLNRPGFSPQDLTTATAQLLSFIPAAKLASLGKTLLAKIGIGGAAAGATEQALQETGVVLGREERDPTATAIAAATGGVAEVITPVIQAVRGARQATQTGIKTAEVEAAKEAIKPSQEAVEGLKAATGQEVGLLKAQQTQLPSDLLKQRVLPQLDAGSKKAAEVLEAQNKEAFEATSELINTIAGPEVTVSGAKQFRTASQKAIESAGERRAIQVRPLYKEALEEGANVSLKTTSSMIDDFLLEAPKGSDFEKVGVQLKNLISPVRKGAKPSLRQLQKAKISMQDIIDGVGDKAVSGPIKSEVVQIKRELVDKMSEASPLFRQAEDKFIELTPAVKEVEDSLLGAAAKVNDIDLQSISRRIFAPNSNPTVIRNAKKLIDEADPEAWSNMLRGELQRRFGGIEQLAEDIPGELVGNVPGQLRRAIFGNPEQRRTLLAAMSPDQKKNFVYLDNVLKRASSGRAAGSPTAAFGQAIEKLKGVGVVLRDAIFRPLKTFQETGERAIFDRNVVALTDVMFNPKFKPQLAKLRKLDPNGPEAGTILREMLDAAKASAQTINE